MGDSLASSEQTEIVCARLGDFEEARFRGPRRDDVEASRAGSILDLSATAVRLPPILWLAFTFFIVYGAAIPFDFTANRSFISDKISRITLNPFVSPDSGRRVSIPDVAQNVLLYVPFGVLGVLALGRPARSAIGCVTLVALLAALLSVTTETLQLFTIDRTTSVSDLAGNTVGALGGAVASAVVLEVSRRTIRRLWAHRFLEVSAFYPMMIATLLVCIAAWEPFDFTLDVGSLIGKGRALQANLWQFGTVRDEGVELLRYVLFGFAVSLWLRQLGVRAAGTIAAIAVTAAAVVLEGSQVFIGSRMPGLKDGVVQAGGAVAGTVLSRRWPGRAPVLWYVLFALATVAAAGLQMLSPFTLASTSHSFGSFPFFAYYEHTSSQVLGHVVEVTLIYLPFGFLLALALRGRGRLWLAAMSATLIVAWPLEYAQGWIDGRYPDITDVGMALLGGLFGAWLGGPGRRLFMRGSAC